MEVNAEKPEGFEWLERLQRSRGRPLRVLHIGNIANNAYNNARLQRRYGIEADVLCHNYYHIMACPEWEDADFTGTVGDDFYPDWWGVKLHGFERPRWFAQGPIGPCIRYLIALRTGSAQLPFLWRCLEFERWLICRRGLFARGVRWGNKVLHGTHAVPVATEPISAEIRASLADVLSEPAAGQSRAEWQESITGYFQAFWHPDLPRLFAHYDVIQAYATYTIMPFLAGRRDYAAYEHGTIRNIPFQDTVEGRCCRSTYRAARAVFVTNSDNLVAARRLGLANDRVVCLPHAFDSDKLERYAGMHRPDRASARGVRVFFSPARQDWVSGDPGWSKGNDRVLHAAARLKQQGLEFTLRLVAWGRDLQPSRELVATLELQDRVQWVQTMKKRELWDEYLKADCVVDQFLVPAIGGVSFEAMMLGRRVITSIDQQATQQFFGAPPPLHACTDVDEIAVAMREVIADPDDAQGRGAANQAWMRRYHSAQRIVALQLAAYRRMAETVQREPTTVQAPSTAASNDG